MDALLKSFVMAGEEQEVPVSASADEGEDSRSPPKRRRIDVRDALYSLEFLAERRGMLEFCTGFEDLLTRRFREVRRSGFVFLHCYRRGIRGCSDVSLAPIV